MALFRSNLCQPPIALAIDLKILACLNHLNTGMSEPLKLELMAFTCWSVFMPIRPRLHGDRYLRLRPCGRYGYSSMMHRVTRSKRFCSRRIEDSFTLWRRGSS